MEEIFKTNPLDIQRLAWGPPTVPLLPKALRSLWGEETLPNWLVVESNLPAGATIATLGPAYWGTQSHISPRVQHYVEFLLKSRVRAIGAIKCFDHQLAVGRELSDMPFSVRSAHALEATGLFHDHDRVAQVTFGELLRTPNLGLKSLLEITTLVEAAVDLHWSVTAKLANCFASPGDSPEGSRDAATTPYALSEPSVSGDVLADDRWAAVLTEALREPWVDQIDEHDARFRHVLPPRHGTLEERIHLAISGPPYG